MNFFVRALVIALALTGAVASTRTSAAVPTGKTRAAVASDWPIPSCPYDDPNGCGIGGGGW